MKKLLILGVNGFIGHHLSEAVIRDTDWDVYGMDLESDRLTNVMSNPRFHFFEGDITINREWVEYHIRKCDVLLPLVAIATPATYISDPLRVFELDFEANLPLIRACVKHRKRVIFPSTSEIYGMSPDKEFHPYDSPLVLGPVPKSRWIYSCSKQLLDRVIWAYGSEQKLDFTLFRPFNWIGPGLDRMTTPKEGSSRVLTQFLGNIVRGENIQLVDGGTQRRCFTAISDGIDALMRIIANKDKIASGHIYNVGNPRNDLSVRELAELMLRTAKTIDAYAESAAHVQLVEVSAEKYYGAGYQDVRGRVPWIQNTMSELGWAPRIDMPTALRGIFDSYKGNLTDARALVDAS
ncbi:MAG TPA: bifunctional UDP-4-keto-pentose/UDP-xylose synthase [Steroidobacteraceae bacterium]|nr:bifunctional UDP-4-keto-pentose/UDP-xylose synthase [Steroidobacteraceae bacterium]